ncbi:hypothetical protein BU25DRAFT_417382 [Macroventuria anomochaeta]|uniref:Uncharacterized protein n=1 Tax=Macroventuria anomochaeta TaxID=301207 RepID=A0ACB6SEY7_9PLEO|nr:uncharacterized protein BU25DRAFT_417382 [Macroventuria anomochaeta]KAF2632791.1 hypothetical protein BU25DRAFT_417382 [Macroventuria anomochaeta]
MKQSQILPTPPSTPPHSKMSLRTPAHKGRTPSRVHFDLHRFVHHSTNLHANSSFMSESGLWTLPGFDDDDESSLKTPTTKTSAKTENRWSRLLQGAASSNRERHRARLEGDGWAFIGGRYSDEMQELSDGSGESVDEEFDVVVLARESVGC